MADSLATYRKKRDFGKTPEPAGGAKSKGFGFVVQKHDATRLHYDFRLELDGVLKSWAVTRGMSLDPDEKRLAVRTEDHPIEYGGFEGTIPKGQYGGGTVMLWDTGTWEPLHDPRKGLKEGKLHFRLHGKRLKGGWVLVRMRPRPKEKSENWLLIKEDDGEASRRKDILKANETSVKSGRAMKDIAGGRKTGKSVWHSRVSAEGKLPKFRPVQLATLVDAPPEGKEWVHELKYDGYRCLVAVGGGRIVCWTRNRLDWTERFSRLVPAIEELKVESALIDGEVVAANEEGRSDFGALQRALKEGGRLSYFAFDLLEQDGEDLAKRPLVERKKMLRKIIGRGVAGTIFYSEHIEGSGAKVLEGICARGGEGIVSKLAHAPYRGTRSKGWLKSKCGNEQEFVIGGWTPSSRRTGFRSLLIGVHEGRELVYAGRVGTGFDEELLESLGRKLRKLERRTSPFRDVPREAARAARWVEPKLVAEIEFTEFTRDGVLRHPSFKGLRQDKPARKVTRERARKTPE